jgi:hypothetical protein
MSRKLFVDIILVCLLANLISAKVIPARSCRPSLPVQWFVHQSQELSLSNFSPELQLKFNNLTNLSHAGVQQILQEQPDLNALSVVVAGPWGHVLDAHGGTLRVNDSHYPGVLNGDSIYRIASISKVSS